MNKNEKFLVLLYRKTLVWNKSFDFECMCVYVLNTCEEFKTISYSEFFSSDFFSLALLSFSHSLHHFNDILEKFYGTYEKFHIPANLLKKNFFLYFFLSATIFITLLRYIYGMCVCVINTLCMRWLDFLVYGMKSEKNCINVRTETPSNII